MGKDDLHKKRKKRQAAVLERALSSRDPYDRVLIVTEGSKTEPEYLQELIKARGLSAVNIVVDGKCGSDPMSVFRHARLLFEEERRGSVPFDRVYCVFDKDGHANYSNALDAIYRAKPEGVYHAISSVPCFEYWVLLHYRYSARAYQAPAGQSPCEMLLKELRKSLSGYQKGKKGLYRLLEDKTYAAIENAKKSLSAAEDADTDNPTTRMHLLVEYLFNLKN